MANLHSKWIAVEGKVIDSMVNIVERLADKEPEIFLLVETKTELKRLSVLELHSLYFH